MNGIVDGKVSVPDMLGFSPVQGSEGAQFPGVLHHTLRARPLVRIPFTEFSTLNRVARTAGIIDKTGCEELASVLKGGRVANEAPRLSVDLDRQRKVNKDSSQVCNDSPYRFHLDNILTRQV